MTKAALLCVVLASARVLWGGESGLTITYQPLDGLGSGEIKICQVTCHDWNGHSGYPTAIGLISAPNVPPTNNPKEATQNLNLASVSGLQFYASDLGDPDAKRELVMDATKLTVAKDGYPKEDIVRASLECLRRVLPEKLRKTTMDVKMTKADKAWLQPIVVEFNRHDRSKVFYTPPE